MRGGDRRGGAKRFSLMLPLGSRMLGSITTVLSVAAITATLAPVPADAADRVVIGSKNFAESRLLGEMFAQLIEVRTGLEVERRLGLAGTKLCFEALRTGAIDVYPEYTGTGLVTLLDESPSATPAEALRRVRAEFLARWDLWWLSPLGFENAYELAIPRGVALEHGLQTISDLAVVAPGMTAGFGYEFAERRDGLPGLRDTYGLRFANVLTMQQALKYQSAGEGRIDCLDVYTTDGRLLVHDLVLLEDDRQFFPPYEAAALVSGEALARHPEIGGVLGLLAGTLDEETMRGFNLRLQEEGDSIEQVATDALAMLGLVEARRGGGQQTGRRRLLPYMWAERRQLAARVGEHLALAGLALGLGALVAVPTGMVLERHRRLAEASIRAIGVTQTIPSLALLAFMIPLFGVGALPAVIALWIYSVFPIVRNTYSGLRDADPLAVDAAHALGMTARQILMRVRLPLAAPIIMAGVRTAGVITIGTATLAAFIGAGGLGVPIISGLQLNDTAMILSGALPAALLAILVDAGLGGVERLIRPGGIDV